MHPRFTIALFAGLVLAEPPPAAMTLEQLEHAVRDINKLEASLAEQVHQAAATQEQAREQEALDSAILAAEQQEARASQDLTFARLRAATAAAHRHAHAGGGHWPPGGGAPSPEPVAELGGSVFAASPAPTLSLESAYMPQTHPSRQRDPAQVPSCPRFPPAFLPTKPLPAHLAERSPRVRSSPRRRQTRGKWRFARPRSP